MPTHDNNNSSEVRVKTDWFTTHRLRQLTEQPWPTEAPAADNNSGAPRLLDHPHSILAGPDIAIAKNRHASWLEMFDEPRDSRPVCLPAVKLRGGAGMKRYPSNSRIGGDPTRVEVRQMIIVDPHAHLHGYGQRINATPRGLLT